MKKPSLEQQAWLNEIQSPDRLERYDAWLRSRNLGDGKKAIEEYLDEWDNKLAQKPTIISILDRNDLNDAVKAKIQKIDRFGIEFRHGLKIDIQNKLIHTLDIQGRARIKLYNCAVKRIDCSARDNPSSSLILKDCWVGYLKLGAESLNYFEVIGGGIRRLETTLPGQKNPFVGSVSIAPSVDFSPDIQNAQAFRNLRHHLTDMHNQEAASVFHSAEMRTLYKQQTKLDKAFNTIYRVVSDYGNSTGRPIFWFVLFGFMNFSIMFLADGVALSDSLEGWQKALCDTTWFGNALRGTTITVTQIVNPLGIFGLKHLVFAKTLPLVVSNLVLCFAATVSLGFFVFALRRRFRLALD